MAKFHFILLTLALALTPDLASNASAQDNKAEKHLQESIIVDEVINQGQRQAAKV